MGHNSSKKFKASTFMRLRIIQQSALFAALFTRGRNAFNFSRSAQDG
jgi:hypothetical protein